MRKVRDPLGRLVSVPNLPKRIVSTVPSQTEVLSDLGLKDRVVGITKFCVHPTEWLTKKEIIGGTKNINIDTVRSLNPDLVIANQEENIKEKILTIEEFAPVWVSTVDDYHSAIEMIRSIGDITQSTTEAGRWIQRIEDARNQLDISTHHTAAYMIWKGPWMTVGGDTFIDSMLSEAGFDNVFQNETRYPVTDLQDLKERQPEYILLSSEPFPFKEQHVEEVQDACPESKVIIVDGEMFSWYGTRMVNSYDYFHRLRQSLM